MVIWIVSMVTMKFNVQGTSVWVTIIFIASKIKLASKLLNDVMEHLIVLVRPLNYKEIRSTYIRLFHYFFKLILAQWHETY